MPFLSKKTKKSFPVKVVTFDSELLFNLERDATGQELFDLVCKTTGLRETWFFGLQYEDNTSFRTWLKMNKRVLDQGININNGEAELLFLAKFYPEEVREELIQQTTQHFFFLQVMQSILSMDIHCPPEASVLLASYAVQAKYGDYDPDTYEPGTLAKENLLPQRVIAQYQMTPEMWEERILTWYSDRDHKGMSRDEAEMEYLRVAQNLDMYAINYFPIKNKKKTELWLGVTNMGLNIFDKNNKILPKTTFTWSEIKHVCCNAKKFIIRLVDEKAKKIVFYSENSRMNELILDLCVGNHELYMRRRKPDTMEIQQMKSQAKEEKQRRQIEKNKLAHERQLRQKVEKEKQILEEELRRLQDDMKNASDALRRSEETAEIYAEKSRVNEEQVKLTHEKALKFKQEMDRLRDTNLQTEMEKEELEKKIRDQDYCMAHLTEEKERRTAETNRLRQELLMARQRERDAALKLTNFINNRSLTSPSTESLSLVSPISNPLPILGDDSCEFAFATGNIDQITDAIEKNKIECFEKSQMLKDRLETIRNELEYLKKEGEESPMDIIANEQLRSGENKYSTLKKLRSGSTKARVAFFEEL